MKFIQPNWNAPSFIKAYTTIKSLWSGEVTERSQLKHLLSLPSQPIWLKQKHTATVVKAADYLNGEIADAAFTEKPDTICVVLTADCLPILITNKSGNIVAAIHAGWRGLSANIIENTVQALNCPTKDLLVWLGPAIGPEKFEVGEDVYQAFTERDPQAKIGFNSVQPKKWLANLYTLATLRLKTLGVNHIFGGEFCTYRQADLFFSYRRDKKTSGRMASLIWIAKK